jgi:HK97 family phage major capsid protein
MTPDEITALASDIKQKLGAIDARLSDEAIEQRIAAAVTAKAEPFTRKLPVGKDDALKGSKFGRMGLTPTDLEFAHALLTGSGKRVSDDLGNFAQTRAMDTAESGYGSQLVGIQYVSELWQGAQTQSRIFALLPQFTMTAPVAYLPVAANVPEMTFVGENTSATLSYYTTTKTGSNRVAVTAYKFVIPQVFSGEMEEDAILPFVPFLRQEQIRSLAYYSDSLVLNGDTTNAGTGNINLHDANPADTLHYLAFDGIRKAALTDNTANASNCGGAVDYDKVLALRGLMVDATYLDDWGHPNDPNDLIFVGGPAVADSLAGLDEVITVDKYGPAATVLTGEITKVGRHPFIASMACKLTEADGMVANTGNTKGQIVAFNRRAFIVGVRRAIKIETERIPGTDQTRIITSTRLGLGRYTPTGAASGIESVAVLYNIT